MTVRLWSQILEKVKGKVPESAFSAWFKPLKPLKIDESSVTVQTPNPLFREWLESHYRGVLEDAAAEAGHAELRFVFVDGAAEDLILSAPDPPKPAKSSTRAPSGSDVAEPPFNPLYRFDTFVVGPSNRFAFAACQAVAQNPSRSYNPLYIYGGVGLGKTHLMQSIGAELRRGAPNLRVCYLSTERFMNEMIASITHRQQHEFRDRYRKADVILLDDVQFLSGKEGTQEELFHTFNALHESQRQIVLSSDCPPRDLHSIEERLRSRFEWGLIADIQPPELETKVAILYKKAEAYRVSLPEDVALFIAAHIKSNIRELEGCLLRLIAFSSFKGLPITVDLARETFESLFKEDGRAVTVEAIQRHVAAYYKMKVQDLKAKSNRASIVFPRQVAMYLAKELTTASLPEIGRKFGGKHHTTVLHAIRKIDAQSKSDPQLQQQIHSFVRSFR